MSIDSKNPNEDISKARPTLKTNTVKQYVVNLKKLQKIYDTDDYDFLKKPEDVMDKLSDLHYLSQRNILNAVVVLLPKSNTFNFSTYLFVTLLIVRFTIINNSSSPVSVGSVAMLSTTA